MTTGVVTLASASPFAQRAKAKSASIVVLLASYDLMLATLIIAAGSQGVYRFVPTILLWILIYAMVSLKIATHLRAFMSVYRDNAAIFAFPAIAILSATWSLTPSHSIYSATQLTITYLAAMWIGWRYRPAEIALIIVIGLSPLIALSLVNWMTGAFGEIYSYTGGLLGVFANKNTLGRMSLLLGLAALGLLIGCRKQPVLQLTYFGIFAMAMLALLVSKSATSTIFSLGASGLLILLTMRGYGAAMRLSIGAAGALAILVVGAMMAIGNIDPAAEILDLFGKSSSLTGRTFLWDIADRQIEAQPWLGVGFDAYWDSKAFLGVDLIQRSYGSGVTSFHNFVLDIRVGLGIPGLVAITVTLGTIAVVYLRYFLIGQTVEAAMMLTMLASAIGVGLFNPLLHNQHGNMIVILIAFAVSARIETRRLVDN